MIRFRASPTEINAGAVSVSADDALGAIDSRGKTGEQPGGG